MKLHLTDLESRNHKNDGSWGTFFYKGEKFTGKVYDTNNDKINWIFEVKDGLQNGLEETYHEGTTIIEQIAEYKDNMQFGISKEFNEDGSLNSISIVWNNKYLKTIFVKKSKVININESYDIEKIKYPEKILMLLNLSDDDLIQYNF